LNLLLAEFVGCDSLALTAEGTFMAAGGNSASRAGEIRLRRAEDEDVERLTRLINAAFAVEQVAFDGERADAAGVRGYMRAGTFLLAEDGAGLGGCVYIEAAGEHSYLGLLSVEPARQGRGLGRKLMAEAEDFARGAGCRVMDLRVISPRAGQLLPFYLRLGYRETGTRPIPTELVSKVPTHYVLMSKPLA
jgi:GNAT superfamily N-acetyltransferase